MLGRNLGMDSQNQGWKGLRGTFGWFPIFGANFRIKCLIQSVTKVCSLKGLHRVPELPEITSKYFTYKWNMHFLS